jgi:hypothetical protein
VLGRNRRTSLACVKSAEGRRQTPQHLVDEATTNFLNQKIDGKVWSVEIDPWSYGYCLARFFFRRSIKLILGDSRDAIKKFAERIVDESPIFFSSMPTGATTYR